jgi:cell division protein ZapD
MRGKTVWDSRAVIDNLLDIQAIFSRTDVKSELLKELDRHAGLLARIATNQGVDKPKLTETISELQETANQLRESSGKAAFLMMKCDLLKSISQRSTIPGGTCAFDLPTFHYWLQQPDEARKCDLKSWTNPFRATQKAVGLVLKFIRESAFSSTECAMGGFFQQTLDQNQSFQLVRVSISRDAPYFAEISGGKHRYTIRFMQMSMCDRPKQADDDVKFKLTRCIL